MSRDTELCRTKLIRLLADGKFHSGEVIAKQLGLSRAAISKHIQYLDSLGLDVYRVTGKGYKLAQPLSLLDKNHIDALLPQDLRGQVDVLNVIDSTNQYVKERLAALKNGYTCLAEAQTAGRGRHGRTWVSPFGASLYMSMFWSFSGGYQSIGGLSLVAGVAIANTLEKQGVPNCQLKWPNDVYLQGKKLSGILIEVEGQMDSSCDCVIGIGLNVDLQKGAELIDQPWIDVVSVLGESVDRNGLVANLLIELTTALQRFEQHGLGEFIQQYKTRDLYDGKEIKLIAGSQTIRGICRGVNENGGLLLESDGQIKPYYGGEISVRPL